MCALAKRMGDLPFEAGGGNSMAGRFPFKGISVECKLENRIQCYCDQMYDPKHLDQNSKAFSAVVHYFRFVKCRRVNCRALLEVWVVWTKLRPYLEEMTRGSPMRVPDAFHRF